MVSRSRFLLLFAGLFLLAAAPVLWCDTLPLFDYPNHLARMHILMEAPHRAALRTYYTIDWQPLPNLAMDVIVPALGRVMGLAAAGKVFVLITFLLITGGTAALHRVLLGRRSLWPLLAFLFLYNRILLWGFLNFLFGMGLSLVALAAWVALARAPRPLRLGVASLFAFATFFAHLMAFGLLGVLVMGVEIGELWRRRAAPLEAARALIIAGLPFLPPLAIFFFLTPAEAGGTIAFARPIRKLDLLFSVFDNVDRLFDIASFALLVLAFAFTLWRGWVKLIPAIIAPLLLLALTYLLMPSHLFTATSADRRLPLALALIFVAGSCWGGQIPRRAALVLGGALALFLVRLGVVTASWVESDRFYAGLMPAIDALPQGARLAVAFPPSAVHSEPTPLVHFPAYAILRRDALVPTLFAYPSQQPVALAPPWRKLADATPPASLWTDYVEGHPDPALEAAVRQYDYLVFVAPRPFTLAHTAGLAPIALEGRFQLFRIDPPLLDDNERHR